METDVTYTRDSFFTTFYANTKDGESVLNALIVADCGDCSKVFNNLAPSIILQIKQAGYTVRKQKSYHIDTDKLLADLRI